MSEELSAEAKLAKVKNFILLDDLHISFNHRSDDLDEISYVAVYTQL